LKETPKIEPLNPPKNRLQTNLIPGLTDQLAQAQQKLKDELIKDNEKKSIPKLSILSDLNLNWDLLLKICFKDNILYFEEENQYKEDIDLEDVHSLYDITSLFQ